MLWVFTYCIKVHDFNIVQKNISHILHRPDDGSRWAFWNFAVTLDAYTLTAGLKRTCPLQKCFKCLVVRVDDICPC